MALSRVLQGAIWLVVVAWALGGVRDAGACDICALHSSTVLDPPRRGFSIHLAEQFTSSNTYEHSGGRNLPVDEWLQSTITNVVIGYGFTGPYRLELTVPFINREYRRLKDQAIDRDDESGLGDVVVTGRFTVVDRVLSDESLARVEIFAGLELPTGDADRLRDAEEDDEDDAALRTGEVPVRPRHGGDNAGPTGIHDQDLALGSGSVDAVRMTTGITTI